MSHSNEVLSSDQEQEIESDEEFNSAEEELPSEELTIEDSDDVYSADEDYVVPAAKENIRSGRYIGSSESEEETGQQKGSSPNSSNSAQSQRANIPSDSDDDEQELVRRPISRRIRIEETDEHVIVPNTRRGIRKKRYVISSDSDEDANQLEASPSGSNSSQNPRTNIPSDEDSDEDEEEFERRALSPRTRMSITGIRPDDLSDSSEIESSEQSNSKESSVENENQASTIRETSMKNKNSFMDLSVAETFTEESDEKDKSSTEEISQEARKSDSESTMNKIDAAVSPKVLKDSRFRTNIESPLSAARYSMQFENAIKEKLSSTLYQPNIQDTHRSQMIESDESDLQILSFRENTIEISSSSNDDTNENELLKTSNDYKKGELIKPKPFSIQPKITTQLPAKTEKVEKVSSRTSKNVSKVELVSQEFYNKQVKKLQDLKLDLQNAEKLLENISKSLPDGGKQLSLRIERLRTDVSIMAQYVATLKVEDDNQVVLPKQQQATKNAQDLPEFNWDELSAAVNQVQPIHTGKQGLATFNNQRELTVECLKDIHSSLKSCPTEDVLADNPLGLRVSLMDHQRHALAWMHWREKQNPRGGILADDMGLGKTLTMISLVLANKNLAENGEGDAISEESNSEDETNTKWTSKGRRTYYHGGTLVVCPASLVRQWEAEVTTKVKHHKLTVCVHHGNNRDTKPKHLRTYDIVVTTYNIVSREIKTQSALSGIKWRRIILDEAHVVRNHKAQMSEGVCALRGRCRWALTGTPIQNKEMDVYALLKFLKCSPFDELSHWKKWIDNKSAGGQQRLNALMKSLMLRRTKVMLQERGTLQCLPQKRTELIEVHLDKNEMNVYQKIMIYSRTLFAQFLHQRSERNADLMFTQSGANFMPTEGPSGAYYKMHQKFTKIHKGNKDVKSHEILVLLLRLRQICCHPGLIDSMLEDGDAEQMESDSEDEKLKIDLLDQLNKMTISDNTENISVGSDDSLKAEEAVIAKASAKVLHRSNPVFDMKRPSSKMLKVLEILKKCVLDGNDKAIVVSQWTSVLNILKRHLSEQGIATLSLNGTIPVQNRQEIVTKFNNMSNNNRVLLLSLTAGGVGLNLIGANHLLLIDLHWNPQLEAQAQDRIYRVGQKKDVIIYKFMCKDTVEERIKALQDHKISIANSVLTGVRAAEGSKLTMDDLKSLFGM